MTTHPGTGGAALGGTPGDAAGGAASGGTNADGPADVASGGAGGGTAGIVGSGGTSVGGKGGATVSGGAGAGGTPLTGGSSGTGGTTIRDAGTDGQPDASPLLTGLVVYYNFENTSGTDVPDVSGNSHPGKLNAGTLPDGGTVGYEVVTGKVGSKALSLHKAGYVTVPAAAFAGATDMTIAAWVNVTTSQSWQRLFDVGINAKIAQNTQTGTKYMNLVPKNSGSNLLFSITTNGYGNEETLSTASLAASAWTHLAVVLAAAGGGKLYVNGTEAVANTALALRAADLGAIDYAFIGKSQFSADPAFDGTVDEFRVYNRALSADEVKALYGFTGP